MCSKCVGALFVFAHNAKSLAIAILFPSVYNAQSFPTTILFFLFLFSSAAFEQTGKKCFKKVPAVLLVDMCDRDWESFIIPASYCIYILKFCVSEHGMSCPLDINIKGGPK